MDSYLEERLVNATKPNHKHYKKHKSIRMYEMSKSEFTHFRINILRKIKKLDSELLTCSNDDIERTSKLKKNSENINKLYRNITKNLCWKYMSQWQWQGLITTIKTYDAIDNISRKERKNIKRTKRHFRIKVLSELESSVKPCI